MQPPNQIEFNGTKGIVTENCPECGRDKWLGQCDDGRRMCQSCFHRLTGGVELPSDLMEGYMFDKKPPRGKDANPRYN